MMQIVQAPRASAILYNLLQTHTDPRPWLLPANICPVVPLTFFKARVPFEFVDISPQSLHMDMERAETLVKTGKYGGLLYAHTYGDLSTPENAFESIKSSARDLFLIDDRCLCIPDTEPPVRTSADVRLYSTGYAKFVELHQWGYAFLRDGIGYKSVLLPFEPKELAKIEQAYKPSIEKRQPFQYHDSSWLKNDGDIPSWYDYCRLIESGLISSKKNRAEINQVYQEKLPPAIQLPQKYQDWRFNIRVGHKRKILDAIFSAGLFASSHYASLAGIMSDGRAPNAEDLADQVINLFNDHYFTVSQAEQTCDIILENLS
jgi:hypothetical protein